MKHRFRPRRALLAASTLAFAMLAGCGDAGDAGSAEMATDYVPQLGVDLDASTRSESGLFVRDLTVGTGDLASVGDTAVVHYTGWLPDGTQFDSSRDRGESFAVPLGAGMVISGWEEGLEGMRVGGRRQLVIPPSLGYGSAGAGGVVPPNATLVFDVELLEVR